MSPTRPLHPTKPFAARSGASPSAKTRGDEELARYAKALAHPARVAILRMLMTRGECICGQIVEGMPLAQATVSQHLKVLKDSGLVQGEVDGPRVCYCVDPKVVKRFQELVQDL